nr:endonuclease/exonuclease/phosphatase family protein [uncultured Actinoplanes sp.]
MAIVEAPAAPPARPARRRAVVTVLVWLVLAPGLIWAVIRLGGFERGLLVPLLAFTPYAAGWSLLPLLLALATRRWTAASIALVAAAGLIAAVLPRALPDRDRGPSGGVPLTVMTSNMLFGGADPATIVRLVRENDVAVLAVQEFTPQGRAALAAAGLEVLLPYSSLGDEPGASGSGVYSRFPVTDGATRRNGGGFRQSHATIQPPGAGPLIVESAHPLAPSDLGRLPGWKSDLDAEPVPSADGPLRILIGDFNATLDHAALRRLIASGYRDAADVTGQGLVRTWPDPSRPLPPITIDHVLADQRIGVRKVSVHDVPRSDHRAVIATLDVPAVKR